MAGVLYLAEFATVGGSANFTIQGAQTPPITEQTVAVDVSAAQSSAFNTNTAFIRLHTDSVCSVTFGTNPTATTSKMRMAANQTEYFCVIAGQKLSVIANT